MQVTTAKLCCSDVFFRTFVRSPTNISCFNRTERRLIERNQLSSSCSVPGRILSNRLYGQATHQPGLKSGRLCCLGSFAAERVFNVLHSNIQPVGDFKDRVRTCWESLDQQIINKSIDQWRDRLKTVVRVNGGHIEQLF